VPHEPHDLQWLIDIEEIKQLKARYAAACDDAYDADAISDLFADDAVWDGGAMGYAATRAGIHAFFSNASSLVPFAVHGLSNPLIEVDGDRAKGRWYLHQPMTFAPSNACFWFCAQYFDEYVRTPDGWKFQHVTIKTRALTPYDQGFGRVLISQLPTRG
jgi:hypothetical protein